MHELHLEVAKVVDNDYETALRELGNTDNDFNGNNGSEYLWSEAKDEGYENNLEYALVCAKEHGKTINEIIHEFFSLWLDYDNYYARYDYSIIRDDEENITSIVLAYTHE